MFKKFWLDQHCFRWIEESGKISLQITLTGRVLMPVLWTRAAYRWVRS